MKSLITAVVLSITLLSGASAAETPLNEGIVKKVDRAAGKVTLTHGPLSNGMPGMTMVFKVRDAARLDGLTEGRKIRFAIDDALTIVHLEAAK